MSRTKSYCTASILALCAAGFAGQVMAADAPPPPAAPSTQLNEVTVTAEKRVSNVQKTPLAVTAVGTAQIQEQHITDVNALNGLVPSVQVYTLQNAVQVEIRGLGSTFLDPRAEGAVANSVDGLYFTKPTSNGGQLFDIARVEILKGPQGTLYGQNAAAGAVNVITNHPVHDYEGMIEVGTGNYALVETAGMVNIPVSDDLALRGAFNTQKSNGYMGHYYGDADYYGLRGEALWTPTSQLTVFAEYNYNHQGGHGTLTSYWPYPGVAPWSLQTNIPGLFIPKFGHQNNTTSNAQLQIDYDFGPVTLKSITGYIQQDTNKTSPLGGLFPTFLVNNLRDLTQEVRLSSNSKADHAGGFQWQVGAYYLNETALYYFFTEGPTNFPDVPERTEAAYGQATYAVTDQLKLTGGLRYTANQKGATPAGGPAQSLSFSNLSYKAGAEYDLTPRNMVYADISTGYIAGGLNGGLLSLPTGPLQIPPSFKSETNTAYEIGSKNRFLDNRLQINADAYYYDFKNYQLFTVAYPNIGPFNSAVANIGDVDTYGVEVDGEFLLTPVDELSASLALAHGEFKSVNYPTFILAPPNFPAIRVTSGATPLINLPEVQFSAGYTHTFELPDGFELRTRIHTLYSSSYSVVVASTDPTDHQKPYWMSDASATLLMHDGKWEVEGWIRNIGNVAVNDYGVGPATFLYQTLPPRTYGVTLRLRFGGR